MNYSYYCEVAKISMFTDSECVIVLKWEMCSLCVTTTKAKSILNSLHSSLRMQ